MRRQVLQKLEIKDLQHYRNTLIKRIQQLKTFNIQLGKDNVEQTRKINEIKMQLSQKTVPKINKSNFDFDDLYKMSVQKVSKLASKDGMKSLWNASQNKLRQGIGFANSMMRKYITKDKKEVQYQQNNQQNVNKIQNAEQNINYNADFNSYDVGVGKYYQNYQPTAEQNLQNENQSQKVKKMPSYQRKKIFDRKYDNKIMNEHKQLQRDYKSQQKQGQEQIIQNNKQIVEKNQENIMKQNTTNKHEQPKQQQKIQIKQQTKEQTKQQSKDKNQKQQQITNKQQTSSGKNDTNIKQVKVEPNQIIDIEAQSQQEQNNNKNEKQKYEHKLTQQNIQAKSKGNKIEKQEKK